MAMKITFLGPKEKCDRAKTALQSTIQPYVNGNGVEYLQKESAELDVKVEGAELIASLRLELMLREQLPRLVSN